MRAQAVKLAVYEPVSLLGTGREKQKAESRKQKVKLPAM
jgi:hypothetical protein